MRKKLTPKQVVKKITKQQEEKQNTPFQPYTWIRCLRPSLWDSSMHKGKSYLFMGYITNPDVYGDNVVLMDERGVFTSSIKEEDFEIL